MSVDGEGTLVVGEDMFSPGDTFRDAPLNPSSYAFSSISMGGARYGRAELSLISCPPAVSPPTPVLPMLAPDGVRLTPLGPRCDAPTLLDKLLPSGPPSTGDDATDDARLTVADTDVEAGSECE